MRYAAFLRAVNVAGNVLSMAALEAIEQPSRLAVVVLRHSPSVPGLERLRNSILGPELVAPGTRHVYINYPAGQAQTRLTNSVIERVLESRGTARNWNTILKMQAAPMEAAFRISSYIGVTVRSCELLQLVNDLFLPRPARPLHGLRFRKPRRRTTK